MQENMLERSWKCFCSVFTAVRVISPTKEGVAGGEGGEDLQDFKSLTRQDGVLPPPPQSCFPLGSPHQPPFAAAGVIDTYFKQARARDSRHITLHMVPRATDSPPYTDSTFCFIKNGQAFTWSYLSGVLRRNKGEGESPTCPRWLLTPSYIPCKWPNADLSLHEASATLC